MSEDAEYDGALDGAIKTLAEIDYEWLIKIGSRSLGVVADADGAELAGAASRVAFDELSDALRAVASLALTLRQALRCRCGGDDEKAVAAADRALLLTGRGLIDAQKAIVQANAALVEADKAVVAAFNEARASLSPEPEPEPEPPRPSSKVTRMKKSKPNGAEAAARPSRNP